MTIRNNGAGGHLLTSESVTPGHPDKAADLVSDSVLDAALRADPGSRVACETMLANGVMMLAGEVRTPAILDYAAIAREAVMSVDYTEVEMGVSPVTCPVMVAMNEQSRDIAQGVDSAQELCEGAGDQGMMFGYATNETASYMPMPISLAHAVVRRMTDVRRSGALPYLRADGKSQVTVRFVEGVPVEVMKVLVSTHHEEYAETEQIREDMWEHVVRPVLPRDMYDERRLFTPENFLVNPTGRFVLGGPAADVGLTGRKIIVDTYGGLARHGGGAFSGKDPSKVDRSGAYAARWVAKNIVAAGLADRAEIQLAYAIGMATPVSVMVEAFGTEKIPTEDIAAIVNREFDLRPGAFRKQLDLHRPIYRKTSSFGHFGRDEAEFTWERTDRAEALADAAGIAMPEVMPA
ncbi:MAG TPA: methionine adenosyltransferase [Solirubrobacteraceae bacterium]|jgi:S-adenosylmethionine synthetase